MLILSQSDKRPQDKKNPKYVHSFNWKGDVEIQLWAFLQVLPPQMDITSLLHGQGRGVGGRVKYHKTKKKS